MHMKNDKANRPQHTGQGDKMILIMFSFGYCIVKQRTTLLAPDKAFFFQLESIDIVLFLQANKCFCNH